ncbi:hypothetical protein BCV70DRAFT_42635 [Testicularia cyperi]|uniref:Uncharacterized protein n=1 Tax=Testicularia cyperi TaxID=1882483 RepID=A0A317XKQ5_9BASI|nr:hypothetical protein BCV70DRAFT_42635 [Testicularia cyperi]
MVTRGLSVCRNCMGCSIIFGIILVAEIRWSREQGSCSAAENERERERKCQQREGMTTSDKSKSRNEEAGASKDYSLNTESCGDYKEGRSKMSADCGLYSGTELAVE